MDCTWHADNRACYGGDMPQTYDYVIENSIGIPLESEYPYVKNVTFGECHDYRIPEKSPLVASFDIVVSEDDEEVDFDCDITLDALQFGALAVGVDPSEW